MARELRDKVIIITGASSGIGAAAAVECARVGMHVVMNARRADKLERTARAVRALGRRAEIVVGDVTAHDTNQRILEAADRAFGGFYAVLANAGYGQHKMMHEFADAEIRRIMEVNFFAGLDLITRAGQALEVQRRPGHLLMTSSCVSKIVVAGHGMYAASKAAQNHICRAMRLELEGRGIAVSSVNPITTRTEFFAVADPISDPLLTDTRIIERTPRMFLQPAERVARAIVRCLRRPRAEVWTSHIVRLAAAAMTLFPPLMDVVMRRQTPELAERWAALNAGTAPRPPAGPPGPGR